MKNNLAKVHDLVFVVRRLKMREITKAVGISKEHVGHILQEKGIGAMGAAFPYFGQ